MKTSVSLPSLAVALILSSSALFAQVTSKSAVDSTKSIPAADEFVIPEVDPDFDMEQLQSVLKYPEEARKNNIQGKVVVQVYINRDGSIGKTRIAQSDNPLLEEAALNAIKQTTFTPAVLHGEPWSCWIAIPITFRLN